MMDMVIAGHSFIEWALFSAIVLIMLALDLGVFHKKSHEVSVKEAMTWTVVWITLAMAFNAYVYFNVGKQAGLEFFTGYLIEKSLSLDNIFVISIIFKYFAVPSKYQHRVLFWGVFGALVFRLIFIFAGVALIQKFHWMIYVFGIFLVFTGVKMMFEKDKSMDVEQNPVVKFARKYLKLTPHYHHDNFSIMEGNVRKFTPLFLVLILIESTDLIFAVDSIPAILAITPDPFIVFTSNVFAILGLRSLYFALAGILEKFHFLKYSLAAILIFVGIKMSIVDFVKIPTNLSVIIIGLLLLLGVVVSLLKPDHGKNVPQ
ncbi:MAG: TerC family protein [Bacteriovoracaceae bacterium]|jgi:tellurite resistance protein TerC|nr:TerC family protein [Bacteriovoracaceae bacterium]